MIDSETGAVSAAPGLYHLSEEPTHMNSKSLQRILTADHIDQDAKTIGVLILLNASPEERLPIFEYGRHLLAGAPPTHGCAARFWGAMTALAPRLPGYLDCIAALIDQPAIVSQFQSKIALFVVLNDRSQAVL